LLLALLACICLLILLARVALLGLARAMHWLGSDSFSATDSAPPVIAAAAQAVQQSQHRLNMVELSTTFIYGSEERIACVASHYVRKRQTSP